MRPCILLCCAFLVLCVATPVRAASVSSLQTIEIENACTHLVLDYVRHRDGNNGDAYAALFAEDGTLAVSPFRSGSPIRGRKAIRAGFDGQGAIPWRRHVMSNIHIEVIDDTHARGLSYVTVYGGGRPGDAKEAPALTGPSMIGEYHDLFIRTAEGWRIAERRFVPVLLSSELKAMRAGPAPQTPER